MTALHEIESNATSTKIEQWYLQGLEAMNAKGSGRRMGSFQASAERSAEAELTKHKTKQKFLPKKRNSATKAGEVKKKRKITHEVNGKAKLAN